VPAPREATDGGMGVHGGVSTAVPDGMTRATVKGASQGRFAVRCRWPRRCDTPLTNPSFIGLIAGKH
jgi:hypothetical protein